MSGDREGHNERDRRIAPSLCAQDANETGLTWPLPSELPPSSFPAPASEDLEPLLRRSVEIAQARKADVFEELKKDLDARNEIGFRIHGKRLTAIDGRDWLKEAYEEVLDLCVYFKAQLMRRDLESR